MTITVRQAQLDTVQVDVHAIRVGRKQMTQTVFRQLLLEHPFDFDKEALRGDLWGLVNYFWKGCDPERNNEREHLHLVWQLGGELRRCCIYEPSYCRVLSDALWEVRRPIMTLGMISLLRRALHDPSSIQADERTMNQYKISGWPVTISATVATSVNTILEALEMEDTDIARRRVEKAKTVVSQQLIELEGGFKDQAIADEGQVMMLVQKINNKSDCLKKGYDLFFSTISDLPQLFIAV